MSGLGTIKMNIDFNESFSSNKYAFTATRKSEMREDYGSASPVKLAKNNKMRNYDTQDPNINSLFASNQKHSSQANSPRGLNPIEASFNEGVRKQAQKKLSKFSLVSDESPIKLGSSQLNAAKLEKPL